MSYKEPGGLVERAPLPWKPPARPDQTRPDQASTRSVIVHPGPEVVTVFSVAGAGVWHAGAVVRVQSLAPRRRASKDEWGALKSRGWRDLRKGSISPSHFNQADKANANDVGGASAGELERVLHLIESLYHEICSLCQRLILHVANRVYCTCACPWSSPESALAREIELQRFNALSPRLTTGGCLPPSPSPSSSVLSLATRDRAHPDSTLKKIRDTAFSGNRGARWEGVPGGDDPRVCQFVAANLKPQTANHKPRTRATLEVKAEIETVASRAAGVESAGGSAGRGVDSESYVVAPRRRRLGRVRFLHIF
ncbi:hypothetical protein OF83DRAFT_1213562 [Amylostereum chailletii]|nr:hypothetical protein OF83DRAFT_1213562 [Amylostereum chailletii]